MSLEFDDFDYHARHGASCEGFWVLSVKIVCEVKLPWLDNLGRSDGVGNERICCLELSLDARVLQKCCTKS